MRNRQTVVPFKGRLTDVIKRRYGKRVKLSEEEIAQRKESGLEERVFVNARRKEIDGLLAVYSHIISPDQLLLNLLNKKARFKNFRVLLVDKFEVGTSYLRLKFKSDMSEGFVQEVARMKAEIEKLEEFLLELTKLNTPTDDLIRRLKKHTRKPVYTNRLLEGYSDLLERVFKIMGISVSTKAKRNTALNLTYIQFALPSSLESALNKASEDDEEEFEVLKRAYDIQQKDLETRLEREGFVVKQMRDFLGVGGAVTATVAYDPQVNSIAAPPRKPSKRKGEDSAHYESRVQASGYYAKMEEYKTLSEPFIKGIYSPLLRTEGGDYNVFESKEEYIEAFKTQKQKEMILSSVEPVIEEEAIEVGVSTTTKKDGTIEEKPIYEYLSKITFKGMGECYEIPRYDVSAVSGEARTAQISDRKGDSPSSLTKVVKIKKMIVGDRMVDVIVDGRYKGFLLEDIVNAQGRLVEGSVYTKGADGSVQKIEMVQPNFELDEETGASLQRGDEVSFLELGAGGASAKYMKVLNNRLKEPYITLSADGSRLVLGLPSGNSSKQDRNAIKELAKIMKPSIEQKKDPRLANTTNGLNPFYYLDASAYEAVRDTLGSCSMSKPALDFLEDYYKELTKRDRALNKENLARFTPEAIGGFVTSVNGRPFRFNNKQMEAMAWMEANEFSGVMALDTGVGKTLLAGGAMRHYMKTKEEAGSTKKFLFVSPRSLQGNFTKEMKDFMTDHSVVENRILEMNYTKFAKIVRDIDRLKETMKMPDDIKRQRRLSGVPSDFWKDPEDTSKGAKYKDATEYFKDKYAICFFDEVNEALTGTKRKAISDLKHPRKVLLSASVMENDPLDLYRLVAVAKGSDFSKEKERAFMERFGNVIGGRFVGLKKGKQAREEFNTWVKANAYFAFKQEVDFDQIGIPQLQVPSSEVVTVAMEDVVEQEYRKVAKTLAREIKAMVRKYRDVLKKGESYTDATFGTGKNAITDFATASFSKFADLVTLSTNPEEYFKGTPLEGKVGNPKLEQAEKILLDRPGKVICYFSADEEIVKKNAKKCSLSGVGGVHVALADKQIIFYRAGKELGSIKKETGATELSEINMLTRRFASEVFTPRPMSYDFLSRNPKGGSTLATQTKDFFELVEEDLHRYGSVLEPEELEEVEAPFEAFLNAIETENVSKVKSTQKTLQTAYYKVFSFVADQWAIKATKSLFKDNKNIRSLSCTDAYAKGFNFQFVNTVVHLDRGAKFDSELVKQRTARAYRTGQAQKVEVVYLDSVISAGGDRKTEYGASEGAEVFKKDFSDMTIDEIKDLVQGADQDFFMDIIRQGMETNLVANYDSVKRVTGESVRVNKNLMGLLLDPTSANLSAVQNALVEEANNPVASLALDPNRFERNAFFQEALQGSSSPSQARETADLTGLSSISEYQFRNERDFALIEDGHILSQSGNVNLEVMVEENLDHTRTIYNKQVSFSNCLPKDAPSRLFFGQISASLRDKNVSVIKADMSGGDLMTLPLHGFNTKIVLPFLTANEAMLGEEESQIKSWLEANERISNGNEVCLSDLFLCLDRSEKELVGQKWWAKNGKALSGLSLSLNTNKVAMRVLNVYYKMKCNEFGLSISDYLTQPSESFDIDDHRCWAVFMDGATTSEIVAKINKYKREFKLAYYSNGVVRSFTPEGVIKKLSLRREGFSDIVEESSNLTQPQPKRDPLLSDAWVSVAKDVARKSLIRDSLVDTEGDFTTASEFEDKE